MRLHFGQSTPRPPTSTLKPATTRVRFWRSFCFASVAALAGCTYGNGGPSASTVFVATAPAAPAHACWSNDDCAANHTGRICMPQTVTKEQLAAEDFLEQALSLHGLVTRLGDTSSSAEVPMILEQVKEDLTTYSHTAQGQAPDAGAGVVQVPLTNAQMQDAAWYQSGATQADMIIRQFSYRLSHAPITTDAQKVYVDITGDSAGIHLDKVVSDLQALLKELEAAVEQMNMLVGLRESDGGPLTLKSCAGALLHYVGPMLETLNGARGSVAEAIEPAAVDPLNRHLSALAQGHALVGKDGNAGACLGKP